MASPHIDLGRVGLWTGALDQLPSSEAVEWVAEADELGYGAMWIPETVGRDPFITAALLLAGTPNIKVATGIANVYEITQHLRGNAGKRQVEGARIGLTHVIGLGSACGIHILEKTS